MNYKKQLKIREFVNECVSDTGFDGKASYFFDAVLEALEEYSEDRIDEMKQYLRSHWVNMSEKEVSELSKIEIISKYTKNIF